MEVEPSVPYSLGVMVQNKGLGAARNVRLLSIVAAPEGVAAFDGATGGAGAAFWYVHA